jgi:hypothetical protein
MSDILVAICLLRVQPPSRLLKKLSGPVYGAGQALPTAHHNAAKSRRMKPIAAPWEELAPPLGMIPGDHVPLIAPRLRVT